MTNDIAYVREKLRRWETFLSSFRLPSWGEIPDFGLFMDQVTTLLTQYLDYMPPELKEDSCITRAAINNYVRLRIMPEPRKKRYYRIHIAYLLMICTLKQTLSIAVVQKLLPVGLSEAEFEPIYNTYVQQHTAASQYFIEQIHSAAAPILHGDETSEQAISNMIFTAVIISGFSKLFAEKLILLEPPEAAE